MNLIEILFHYRDLVRDEGERTAKAWLFELCLDASLNLEIQRCVNPDGDFQDNDYKKIVVHS